MTDFFILSANRPWPLSLRSTCTSARVHEAWPEQGPEGLEREHQDVQSVSGSAAARRMQKGAAMCVCILISLLTVNTGSLLSMYWLFYWRHTGRECMKVLWKQLCGLAAFQCGWVIITWEKHHSGQEINNHEHWNVVTCSIDIVV